MPSPAAPFESLGRIEALTGHEIVSELQYRLPIVFVPGIMGSRLRITGQDREVRWEPDDTSLMEPLFNMEVPERRTVMHPSNASSFPEDLEYADFWTDLLQTVPPSEAGAHEEVCRTPNPYTYTHTPIERIKYEDEFKQAVKDRLVERGWNEVAWTYYGALLTALEAHNVDTPYRPDDPDGGGFRGGDCPVYAAGYDWRVSNSDSAREYLKPRITEVVEAETDRAGLPTDKVILITHSMGGLVARSYLEQFAGHACSHVAGVVHIDQPTYGAPVLYRRLKTGAQTEHELTMVPILKTSTDAVPVLSSKYEAAFSGGGTPEEAAAMLGAFPSVMELLPSRRFEPPAPDEGTAGPWLRWAADAAGDGTRRMASVDDPEVDLFEDAYLEESGAVGVVPPNLPASYAQEMREHVRSAGVFQQQIAEAFHAHTFWIASSGVDTDCRVVIVEKDWMSKGNAMITETLNYITDNPIAESLGLASNDPADWHEGAAGTDTVVYHVPDAGDGTVPLTSQTGPAAAEDASVEQLDGVKHASACGAPAAIRYAKRQVQQLIDRHVEEQ